jgi:hypothetical protein
MKKLYFLIVLLVAAQGSLAQALSPQAEISVITCGPGQEAVFTAFGHSAFRVFDPVNGIDAAFNYGVFDFDQPNFYLNFARGYNRYRLAVQDFERFRYVYTYYNRYIHEQVLNLNTAQKQRLFDYLMWNAQPENQYYYYNYFYDNCATKMPQILQKVFADSVTFDGSHITTQHSIRSLTDQYLSYQPWGDLGIDLCLGLPMDKRATPFEYMFLPDYVEAGFDHASFNGAPLVKEKRSLNEPVLQEFNNGPFQPLYVFSVFALLVVVLSAWDIKRRRALTLLDSFLFGVTGLVGLLLLLLWVATDHAAAAKNLNLLWAWPTHLVFAIVIWRNTFRVKYYAWACVVISVLLLALWSLLPQALHVSLIPLVVSLGIRSWVRAKLSSVAVKG